MSDVHKAVSPFYIVKKHPADRRNNKMAEGETDTYNEVERAIERAKRNASQDRVRYVVMKAIRCYGPVADVVEIPVREDGYQG